MTEEGRREVAVVGPGALGCLLAAALAGKTSEKIMVLDHDSKRAALLQHHGITLEYPERNLHASVLATADPAVVGPASLVLLCVKSTAVQASLPSLLPLLDEDSLLLAFQNGIAHIPLLQNAQLPGAWGLAVTSLGATLLAPGRVRFGGAGRTSLGFAAECGKKAEAALLSATILFNAAGIETETSRDILAQAWDKLLVNVGINALTALYQCKNGELLEREETRAVMSAAVEEAAMVARASGIAIAPEPAQRTIAVCRATAGNISSMLQDIRRGRRTEIEAINGAVIARAEELGLAVPVNRELFSAIKALENRDNHVSP